jgi:hypothetical protein
MIPSIFDIYNVLRKQIKNICCRLKIIEEAGLKPTLTATQIAYGDGSNLMTSSSDLVIDVSGGANAAKVGINTSTPSVALDVVGNIELAKDVTYISGLINAIPSNGTATIGDWNSNINGTYLKVDDGGQQFVFNASAVSMNFYGAGAATFDANGNITSVSDERLKNIKGSYTSGLKELMNVNPILYKWNDKSKLDTLNTYAGFSAQNIRDNIPFGTGENKEGYLSLQDRALMATMVNAIKELKEELDALKQELSSYKGN